MSYRPLQHGQIRLLQLLPQPAGRQDVDDANIECRLIHDVLESSANQFEALSYVWGDDTARKSIQVDGYGYSVTANLFDALRCLRLDSPRILWVDAVCINQQNLGEKSEQIAQMRDIYCKASSVVVFLGDTWDGADLAVEFFAAVAASPDRHYEPSLEPHLIIQGHDASSALLRQNLVRFLDLPWWKRLWTAQEYALARTVSFQCGRAVLPGDVVRDAYATLRRHERSCCWNSPAVTSDATFGMTILESFLRMDATERARDFSGGHESSSVLQNRTLTYNAASGTELSVSVLTDARPFLFALDDFRGRQTSDPRDKIYGLTGMFYTDDIASHFKKPDYMLSVEELYVKVAQTIISDTSTLEVLSRARGYCPATLDLPSFIPDWSVDRTGREALLLNYMASHGWSTDWVMVGPRTAQVSAMLVDTVARLGDPYPGSRFTPDMRALFTNWIFLVGPEENLDIACRERTGCFSKPSAFWRTLCGEMVSYRVNGELNLGLIEFEDSRAEAEELQYQAFLKWFNFSMSGAGPNNDADLAGFQATFEKATNGRRFGVTREGRLAMFPVDSREGDIVAVLQGAYVPFVLRPHADGFEVVGEAYVHGIMMGEAYEVTVVTKKIILY